MERDEVDKFTETATWRMQLERRLRVSSMLTSYFTLQAFEASRLLNIFWGVGLVVAGDLEPTRLLMAVINLQQVVSEYSNGCPATFQNALTQPLLPTDNTRQLFNLLPQFFMVMEPLERLAALLESRPKIEPPPQSYDSALVRKEVADAAADSEQPAGRRPERYEGRFVFDDVHFFCKRNDITESRIWFSSGSQ